MCAGAISQGSHSLHSRLTDFHDGRFYSGGTHLTSLFAMDKSCLGGTPSSQSACSSREGLALWKHTHLAWEHGEAVVVQAHVREPRVQALCVLCGGAGRQGRDERQVRDGDGVTGMKRRGRRQARVGASGKGRGDRQARGKGDSYEKGKGLRRGRRQARDAVTGRQARGGDRQP